MISGGIGRLSPPVGNPRLTEPCRPVTAACRHAACRHAAGQQRRSDRRSVLGTRRRARLRPPGRLSAKPIAWDGANSGHRRKFFLLLAIAIMRNPGFRTVSVGESGGVVKVSKDTLGGARRGHNMIFWALCGGGIAGLLLFRPTPAEATHHAHHHHTQAGTTGFAPAPVSESIVLDADTGRVLSESNADAVTYPASLTKMMTLYLTFEALNHGSAAARPVFPVQCRGGEQVADQARPAAGRCGRRAGPDFWRSSRGRPMTPPRCWPRVWAAASLPLPSMMNRKAQQLGMTEHRLPQRLGPARSRAAHDGARYRTAGVGALSRFPARIPLFLDARSSYFTGRIIVGHDHLLDWYPGADGIKTGYIRASGFNLATSAVRDGHRLVGVVLGGSSGGSRDREMGGIARSGICRARRRSR